jgi:site-specific recombinase XerD
VPFTRLHIRGALFAELDHDARSVRRIADVELERAVECIFHLRGPLVFCSMSGGLLGVVDTRLPLWRACKKAGLRQIGWHALRHTSASHLVMRGASIKAEQELLGHSSIQMTMRYAHLAPEMVPKSRRKTQY